MDFKTYMFKTHELFPPPLANTQKIDNNLDNNNRIKTSITNKFTLLNNRASTAVPKLKRNISSAISNPALPPIDRTGLTSALRNQGELD